MLWILLRADPVKSVTMPIMNRSIRTRCSCCCACECERKEGLHASSRNNSNELEKRNQPSRLHRHPADHHLHPPADSMHSRSATNLATWFNSPYARVSQPCFAFLSHGTLFLVAQKPCQGPSAPASHVPPSGVRGEQSHDAKEATSRRTPRFTQNDIFGASLSWEIPSCSTAFSVCTANPVTISTGDTSSAKRANVKTGRSANLPMIVAKSIVNQGHQSNLSGP